MKKLVITIVGLPGSGKSEASEYLKSLEIPVISMGDVTRQELVKQQKEITEQNEREFRERVRSEHGMGIYAQMIEERLSQSLVSNSVVVLEGLRSFAEYEYLSQKGFPIQLLLLFTNPSIRYQRLSQRLVRPLQERETKKRDIAELRNLDMATPIALADVVVENNQTIEQLHRNLQKVIEGIKESV